MCDKESTCKYPNNLKDKPEKCSPKQVKSVMVMIKNIHVNLMINK
ncbi:hypothetical protein [Natranaerobius trueperi]|nr:hypothetical protein [Natranaerobius trueperi]